MSSPTRLRLRSDGIFFVFLLPLFFFFNGYVRFYGFLFLSDIAGLLVQYTLVATLLLLVFRLLLRSWRKAALFVFLVLVFHCFFGVAHDALKRWIPSSFVVKYSFLLPASLVGFIYGFIYLRRSRRSFRVLSQYLNLVLVVLIAIELLRLPFTGNQYAVPHFPVADSLSVCDTCPKPDVHLIVADEYPGLRQLAGQYGFDNSPFEKDLRSRGFCVPAAPRSNYNFTIFSMASILNLSYLDIKNPAHMVPEIPLAQRMIEENLLCRFFLKQGYTVRNNSFFHLPSATKLTAASFVPEKSAYITSQTFVSRITGDLSFHLLNWFKTDFFTRGLIYKNRNTNTTAYREAMEDSKAKGPQFVYTHLLLPHYPFYYRADGSATPTDSLENVGRWNYLGYVRYTNRQLLRLVDSIQKNAERPPVIVLMSDHGHRDFNVRTAQDTAYHFTNLCAVLIPEQDCRAIPDSLSAVNVFRVVLNQVLGQRLPLLKDASIYLKD